MEMSRAPLHHVNVHPVERWASLALGGGMALSGLRKGWSGLPRILAGAAIIQRGVSGQCPLYQAFGISTAQCSGTAAVRHGFGIRARASVTIDKPRHELFQFWRDLENLPHFLRHVESVERRGEKQTHWVARGLGNRKIEWDAEIINEIENELIAWKSLPGASAPNAGSVRFKDAPGQQGTEVHVELEYEPPAGIVGAQLARLFGREPEQQIEADLGRLKQYLESGETATTEGQPKGPKYDGRRRREGLSESKPLLEEVMA